MIRRPVLWYALVAGVSLGGFLVWSREVYGLGFPLDDAWIHQTYARNLVKTGEWAFIQGQPSAGSTSPLWTLLLAAGYRAGVEFHLWTYLMGFGLLVSLAWLTSRLTSSIFPGHPIAAWAAGLAVAFEWHLLWAAGSGMETLLFACLAVAVLRQAELPPLPLGLLLGMAVATRPDGLTLLPFAALGLSLNPQNRGLGRSLLTMLVAFGVAFGGYLLFNDSLGGEFWPNTLYAKQAEYASLLSAPLGARWLRQWVPLFAGGLAVLMPGLLLAVPGLTSALLPPLANPKSKVRNLSRLLPLAWAVAYVSLYALRLPVTYQHGRYALPVLPVMIAYGVEGAAGWLRLNDPRLWRRVLSRAWAASAVSLWAAFAVVGAGVYARDVAIIETEMVAAARWVSANTRPDDVVAAHDIGALGYFAERPLLDLAGLISPDVIPFIRDEPRLAEWLNQRGAEYLVAFPGWYPVLASQGVVSYVTHGPYSPEAGGENMVVLRWGSPTQSSQEEDRIP